MSLHTIHERVMGQLLLGEYQHRYRYDPSWTIGGANHVQRDYLHITQTKPDPEAHEPTGFLGVDM